MGKKSKKSRKQSKKSNRKAKGNTTNNLWIWVICFITIIVAALYSQRGINQVRPDKRVEATQLSKSSHAPALPPKGKKQDGKTKNERKHALKKWLHCMDNIVGKTIKRGYTIPQLVLNGYAYHAAVGKPDDSSPRGFKSLGVLRTTKNTLFTIIPIINTDKDTRLGKVFAKREDDSWIKVLGGAYDHHSKTINLNNTLPLSCTMKGIIALHEGLHAYRMITGKTPMGPDAPLIDEIFARIFEQKILEIVGTKSYHAALAKKTATFSNTIRMGYIANKWKLDKDVDTFFNEPANNHTEKWLRIQMLTLHAIFKAVDSLNLNHNQSLLFKRSFYTQVMGK
jgi:hypothetical protein